MQILQAPTSVSNTNHHPSLAGLKSAKTSTDVKRLMESYGHRVCNESWQLLSPMEKASLILVKEFGGTIIHDD